MERAVSHESLGDDRAKLPITTAAQEDLNTKHNTQPLQDPLPQLPQAQDTTVPASSTSPSAENHNPNPETMMTTELATAQYSQSVLDVSLSPGSPSRNSTRVLNASKRAEQNRKAQRAFRERRDQKMQQLAQRSAMLDDALNEANLATHRWTESMKLAEELQAENAILRATLKHHNITRLVYPDAPAPARDVVDLTDQDPDDTQTRKRRLEEDLVAAQHKRRKDS